MLKFKRMVYDAKTKNGIGSYTPRDEKSQEAGSLVGNIDYSMLTKFGSRVSSSSSRLQRRIMCRCKWLR